MPLASDDVTTALAELQLIIQGTSGFDAYCAEVLDWSVAVLAPIQTFCSLTLRRDGRLQTVASSHIRARLADENQFRQYLGPCLDAMRRGRQVIVDDLALDSRWLGLRHPGFGAAASSPVLVAGQAAGTLNVYCDWRHAFTAAERSALSGCAHHVSVALGVIRRLADQADLSAGLEASMATRSIVDQAVGVIMGQSRCTADDAFGILRQTGLDQDQRLGTAAAAVVLAATADVPYSAPDPS